jgi:hypothetical protein
MKDYPMTNVTITSTDRQRNQQPDQNQQPGQQNQDPAKQNPQQGGRPSKEKPVQQK